MQQKMDPTMDVRAIPYDADPAEAISRQYFTALARLQQPAWRKLVDPGPLRFLDRLIARHSARPARRQVSLFFGSSMDVLLPEVISEQLHGYGLFDDVVSWMALCAVQPGDTVFDVGAHFGYFSLLFATLSGHSGRVFSFEPTPSTFTMLESNVKHDPRITPVNAAAGEAPGQMSIADYGLKFSAWNTLSESGRLSGAGVLFAPDRVDVTVVTLDTFAAESGTVPDFIKIDAENFEPEVLRGATGLLESARPSLLLEAGSPRAGELAASLARAGYRAFSTDEPGMLSELADAAAAARRCKDVLFAAGARADRVPLRARAMAAVRRGGAR